MVVVDPPLLADGLPGADRAVLDGERVRLGRVLDELEKPRANAPVVRDEVGDAKRLAIVRPEHDVHPLGQPPLNPPELLGVERELEQEVRLRVPRELRVGDLVRPVRLPLDEVGDAAPPVGVDEDALVDDVVRAGADRVGGDARRALPVAVVGVDDEDALALGAELREVRALVLVALAPDELGLRIVDVRPSELPARDREPERSEVLALEEVV